MCTRVTKNQLLLLVHTYKTSKIVKKEFHEQVESGGGRERQGMNNGMSDTTKKHERKKKRKI